ncbi:hypothetical protein CRG98_017888 [Punica granatum]|uniref:Uncharacterized protein n=1 Tax=Punica granatum TaxID=22663 RepID=A0A2I0JZ97_PUNGR|nr:hypothetical protein CRG98_017888 [Punica granatum]
MVLLASDSHCDSRVTCPLDLALLHAVEAPSFADRIILSFDLIGAGYSYYVLYFIEPLFFWVEGIRATIDAFKQPQGWSGDPCLLSKSTWQWLTCNEGNLPGNGLYGHLRLQQNASPRDNNYVKL